MRPVAMMAGVAGVARMGRMAGSATRDRILLRVRENKAFVGSWSGGAHSLGIWRGGGGYRSGTGGGRIEQCGKR